MVKAKQRPPRIINKSPRHKLTFSGIEIQQNSIPGHRQQRDCISTSHEPPDPDGVGITKLSKGEEDQNFSRIFHLRYQSFFCSLRSVHFALFRFLALIIHQSPVAPLMFNRSCLGLFIGTTEKPFGFCVVRFTNANKYSDRLLS